MKVFHNTYLTGGLYSDGRMEACDLESQSLRCFLRWYRGATFWGLWSGLDGDCWNLKIFARYGCWITNAACSKWVISLHATTPWVKIRKMQSKCWCFCSARVLVKDHWIMEWTEHWQHPHKTLRSFSKEEGGLLPGCLWRRFGSCLFVLWSGFGHLAPEQHMKFFFFLSWQ